MSINKSNITIAYIGGGSMNFGWSFLSEICREEKLSGTVRLFDIDKKLALANELLGNRMREYPDAKTGMIFLAVDTLQEALRDADFVILSINHGGIDEQLSDIELPAMCGIIQAIGDNSGPGGIMRTIRTLPAYVEFAKRIKELCPKAWVINLTQPMSACLKTLYRTFPEIKAFGSSNEIFATQELISDFVAKATDNDKIARREIKTSPIGINRFVWFNEVAYEGMDLFDIYAAFAKKYADDGYEPAVSEGKVNAVVNTHKVKFDLFLRYGLIAATHDRGLADSCPPWYISSAKIANHYKIGFVTPSIIRRTKADKIAKCRQLLNDEDSLKIGWSGTDVITQIKAILGISNVLTNAVMINNGQVKNLPDGSVVETNALFSQNSVKPVHAGEIPADIYPLIIRQVCNTDIIVDAVLHKNLDYAFNVFINDPLMTLDIVKATDLYREMLGANGAYLQYYME